MRMHRVKQRHPPRQTRRICRPQAKPSTIFDPARHGPRSNYTRVISISNETPPKEGRHGSCTKTRGNVGTQLNNWKRPLRSDLVDLTAHQDLRL